MAKRCPKCGWGMEKEDGGQWVCTNGECRHRFYGVRKRVGRHFIGV